MGTPPACTYATLYFTPHENNLLEKYPELQFYRRYIDDIIGIWVPLDAVNDYNRWQQYKNELNNFGKLKWEVSERTSTVNYLDLNIKLNNDGSITTDLYEKEHNLYLYLPAHSNHPKGNLKGLIYGSLYRIHRLTSDPTTRQKHIQNLYTRLLARGYDKTNLLAAIKDAHERYGSNNTDRQTTTIPNNHDTTAATENRIYIHIPYHPADPPSNTVQTIFRQEIQYQHGLPSLDELKNHKNAASGITRLIVAYHRPPNLGNLLSPRVMKAEHGPAVSSYLD
jgi:hypothetical protein